MNHLATRIRVLPLLHHHHHHHHHRFSSSSFFFMDSSRLQQHQQCHILRHRHLYPHHYGHQNNARTFVANAEKVSENTVSSSSSSSPSSSSSSSSLLQNGPWSPLVVVSFYKFAHLPDFEAKRPPLKDLCEELRVSGGIILALEGINGSICGTREAVEKVLESIQSDTRLSDLRRIESPATDEQDALHHGHTQKSPLGAGDDAPFRWGHVRVKLKHEIVTLGLPEVSPANQVGKYVKPKDWNALIEDEGTMVVDVRNSYEIRIGRFKGAVDPETDSFREFPSWVENNITKHVDSSQLATDNTEMHRKVPQRVAMYCTGGIRCEKATSLLLSKGFNEVYHLEGGILKYLEEVPESESMWEGECFVFDKRVSVEHGLKPGTYKLCYACKKPVSDEDMLSPEWEEGVSCPHCFDIKSEKERERARARQKQSELWGLVGGPHKGKRLSSNLGKNTVASGPTALQGPA